MPLRSPEPPNFAKTHQTRYVAGEGRTPWMHAARVWMRPACAALLLPREALPTCAHHLRRGGGGGGGGARVLPRANPVNSMGDQLTLRGQLTGHNGWVTAISTTVEDPNLVLSASRDKTIIVWQLTRAESAYGFAARSLQGHSHCASPPRQMRRG